MKKPTAIFDRDWEWSELRRFVADPRPGITLGIVSGRRRQGKSLLLHGLAEASRGFYHETIDGNETEILRDLGAKLAGHLGLPGPLALSSSEDALGSADLRRVKGFGYKTLTLTPRPAHLRSRWPRRAPAPARLARGAAVRACV